MRRIGNTCDCCGATALQMMDQADKLPLGWEITDLGHTCASCRHGYSMAMLKAANDYKAERRREEEKRTELPK